MVGKKGGLGMEQRFALDGGVGALSVREEGPRASIAAERPDDGRGLYKAYLRGRGGSVLLGTMTPENGRLLVRRTFSLDELRRRGAWPVLGGAAEMAFSFRGEETPPQGWSWGSGGFDSRPPGWDGSCAGGMGRGSHWHAHLNRSGNFRFRSSSVWGASRALGAGASCSFPLTGAAGPSCGKHE